MPPPIGPLVTALLPVVAGAGSAATAALAIVGSLALFGSATAHV